MVEIIRRSKFVNYIYYGLKLDNLVALTGLFGFNKRVESSIQGELSLGKLVGADINTIKKDIKKCYVK